MKNCRFATSCLLLTLAIGALLGCKKTPDSQPTVGTVSLELANMAGAKSVALDGTAYATASGETFTVSTLKYYLSNFKFTKSDGSTYAAPGEYHLVDADKASSTAFTISQVPVGDYTGVSFLVGVDSTTTKADPLSLTGDLNPANNMYWAWASGHIFLKLEGTVTSTSKPTALTCHIGGYRAPYSAIVTAAPSFNGSTLPVRADHAPAIRLSADVLKIFDGPTAASHVPLASFTEIMNPSARSVQMAQNYAAGMFSVQYIHAN